MGSVRETSVVAGVAVVRPFFPVPDSWCAASPHRRLPVRAALHRMAPLPCPASPAALARAAAPAPRPEGTAMAGLFQHGCFTDFGPSAYSPANLPVPLFRVEG